jgi:hypothetical protein
MRPRRHRGEGVNAFQLVWPQLDERADAAIAAPLSFAAQWTQIDGRSGACFAQKRRMRRAATSHRLCPAQSARVQNVSMKNLFGAQTVDPATRALM